MVTETDELAVALDSMLLELPAGTTRAEALRALLMRGVRAVAIEKVERAEKRRKALGKIGEKYAQVWPDNWREESLNEWPE
ncbi:MAG: hypothetical protein RLZ88_781 [Actinomycetota bacterium]